MMLRSIIWSALAAAILVTVVLTDGPNAAKAAELVFSGCSVAECDGGELGTDFRSGRVDFEVHGDASDAEFLLLRFFRFQSLGVRYEFADGQSVERRYGQSIAVENWHPAAQFRLPVPERGSALTAVHFDVGPSYEAHLLGAARIVSGQEAQRRAQTDLVLFGLLIGMVLVPLIANIALFFTLRKGFQLAYGFFSIGVLAYGFAWSNIIFAVFPETSFAVRYGLAWGAIGVAVFANISFLLLFVERRTIAKLPAMLLVASVAVFSLLCFYAAISQASLPSWYYTVQHVPLVVSFAALVTCCVVALRRGSRLVWFYIAGWTPLVASASARVLRAFGIVPHSNDLDLTVFGALAFEALVFSVAIGVKAYALRQERDAARARQHDLAEAANTDPLTGVLNRRGLIDRLRRMRRGEPISVFLLDIDHFKRVNDRHGHYSGDVVLAEFARLVSTVFPGSITVRCGGEEFGIVVRNADMACLPVDAALDLLDEIRAHNFSLPDGGNVSLSASIGVASGAVDPETFWTALYRQADQALFLAKANGRDRIEANAGTPDLAAAL